tara:strand:+ start:700 stop:1560 length:861 start_codon:yes stop_codon:yes gene_type:complete
MATCQFCQKTFSTVYKMKNHQKKAKYCLKLQGKNMKCICGNIFLTIKNLNKHQQLCHEFIKHKFREEIQQEYNSQEEKYKIIIDTLRQKIKEQQDQIQNLQNKLGEVAIKSAGKPTTTNNIINIVQNLQPIEESDFTKHLDHLSIEHIKRGPSGYADYALEYPLKDKIICVDYARRKVKFKNISGDIITDPEMNNLATTFFQSIKDKNKKLILEQGSVLKEQLGDEQVDTIMKLFDMEDAVSKGAKGQKDKFHHEFVKNVCSQTCTTKIISEQLENLSDKNKLCDK